MMFNFVASYAPHAVSHSFTVYFFFLSETNHDLLNSKFGIWLNLLYKTGAVNNCKTELSNSHAEFQCSFVLIMLFT